MTLLARTTATLAALALAACAEGPRLPETASVGPSPQLPRPHKQLIPTVKIAPARGWPRGMAPTPAAGLRVTALATGLDHPRWLLVLPNGDILVAETNAPPKPEDGKGVKGFFMKLIMKRAGAGVPSANRITLLRDNDGDGMAEARSVLLQGLNSPFGMALVGSDLYVANSDAVVRFPYRTGETRINSQGIKLTDLPAGPINHHWTKGLIASRDGSKLYATVGSNSNVAENGMAAEDGRAAIWEIDRATGAKRLYATGLRNPNGMGWAPGTGQLWTVANERDEIGDSLVPDYLTSVRPGGFYGWPYSYWGQNIDARVKPRRPDLVARAIKPDYGLGAHVAALGLAFYDGSALPQYRSGALVGLHGSWNRSRLAGYKVVFVPFSDGRPSGPLRDVLTGFVSPRGKAYGRPVGVAVDRSGGILVADDVGNTVWRISADG